ncbi:MAG: NAD-dependent epimerase/dehydratase family protein [Elusimicrobiota bacterium]
MKKILITGSQGFTAKHLIDYLKKAKERFHISGIDILENAHNIGYDYYRCNLLNETKTRQLLSRIKPDYIFHLAGTTENQYKKAFEHNVETTYHLFNVLSILKLDTSVLSIGSAAEYGIVKNNELPVKETNPLRPINYYGISKVAQTFLCRKYYLSEGMKVMVARTFNLIGPGQPGNLFMGSLINQLVQIKKGKSPPEIYVGNLYTERDFIDVRDAVEAYWKIIDSGACGEIFNVGSGKSYSINYVLRTLVGLSGLKNVKIIRDKSRARGVDIKTQTADISKIKKTTGWQPRISITESLKNIIGNS